MPARDIFHEAVRNALVNDGWTISKDPLHLKWGRRDLYVDLAAEKFLAAEKGGQKIAVEVKGFTSPSTLEALEQALGQFLIYRSVLRRLDVERMLHLAVSEDVYADVFARDVGQLVIEDYGIPLLVFDAQTEVIIKWTL
jgi:hypothetical protein